MLLMLLAYTGAYAQLSSNYNFSSSSGTYSSFSDGTTLFSYGQANYMYADNPKPVTLPQSMDFNGSSYSQIYVSPNGFISFGTTNPGTYVYNPISGYTSVGGIVSAYGYYAYSSAVSGSNTSIKWKQIGSDVVIQYTDLASNFDPYGTRISFQIRLNTCNGKIQIVYGSAQSSFCCTYYGQEVGLRGSSNSDFLNRSISSGDWSGSSNGSNSYDKSYHYTSSGPSSGLTYTYTPSSGSSLAVGTLQYNTASVAAVAPGATGKAIMRIDIPVTGLTGTKVCDTVKVTSMNTNDADVTAVKLYASLSPSWNPSASTLLGTGTFSGGTVAFNDINDTLICATNYLFIVYDVSASATVGNSLDCKIAANDITISGTTYPSTQKSPSGSRTIMSPVSYVGSVVTQTNGYWVEKGATNQEIIGIRVEMSASGAPINLDSFTLSTTGTNGTQSPTTNIQNARLWYTGSSSTFATNTQYGSTVANPNGTYRISGTQEVGTGYNYFWLTYDIKAAANTNDSVDARSTVVYVGGSANTPSTTSPAGYRKIRPAYCSVNHSYNYSGYSSYGITKVQIGATSNTSSSNTASAPAYTDYAQSVSFSIKRLQQATIDVTLGTGSSNPNGIAVYIDYNQDGDFYDAGEKVVDPGAGNATNSSVNSYNFAVPCNASLGATRMRVLFGFWYSGYFSDPCQNYGYGETEDYSVVIGDSAFGYFTSKGVQNYTIDVEPGTNSQRIMSIPVVTSGCNGTLAATNFNFNTTGSTNASSDITNARVYWTGNSSTFATTTSFGTTASPSGSFSVTGSQNLVADTNWFWLCYDISGSATVGNVVDAQVTGVTVGSNTYTPTTTNPSGSRTINNAMTYSACTVVQPVSSSVGKGTRYHRVARLDVAMSATGAPVNLTQIKWSTSGTSNPGNDIDTARIYFTGNSNVFATTTQFGSYILNPNGNVTTNGSIALSTNTNYFWIAYSVKASAPTNDSVDACISQITVDGSFETPTTTCPAGKRRIIPGYCTTSDYYQYAPGGITNVNLANISNSSSAPTTSSQTFSDFTHISTDLRKSETYTLSVDVNAYYSYDYVAGWIDFNQDGDYDDSGEKLGESFINTSNGTANWTFTMPCSAATGETRMRIREEYYGYGGGLQPCYYNYYYYGEVEEYTLNIVDSPLTIISVNAKQDVTSAVGTNTTNSQLIRVQVVAKGCTGTQSLTQLNFNTTGSSDPDNDVDSFKVYYTGTSNTFASTTLFGKVGSQNGSFSITGTQNLVADTNNFWLVVNVSSGATINDYLDAQCPSVVINTNTVSSSISSPSGNRQILNPMTYTSSKVTQTLFSNVAQGATSARIMGYEIVMSTGTSVNLDSLIMSTSGTSNVSSDISNAKIYYTGNSSSFATTTQYGGTVTSFPSGEINVGGTLALLPGTNYFWLTYDVSGSAPIGDDIDAQGVRARINGTAQTPSPSTVSGVREVMAPYCATYWYYNYYAYSMGITNVTLGSINNTTGTSGYNPSAQYDYTTLTTNLIKSASNTISVSVDHPYTYGNYSYIGVFIDLNQDGDFYDAGEMVASTGSNPVTSSGSFNFTIPCSASTGSTRMRVILDVFNYTGYDPCGSYYAYGEAEDYSVEIVDSPLTYVSSITTQANTSAVSTGSSNNEVIGLRVTAAGCSGTLNATSFTLNTSGTTNTADISNAKLWYTGSSNVFALTTQIGSTIASPSGTMTFTGTQSLLADSNFFWLTYNVGSGATNGNVIDATCTSITVNSNNYTPSVTAPSGSRTIATPMTYSSHTWTKNTGAVGQGSNSAYMTRLKVTMSSGATINMDTISFTTSGSDNISTNVTAAKLYFTGSSSTFATTTQYGSTVSSPSGSHSVAGTAALAPGDNYFWIAYDVSGSANVGDSIVANLAGIAVGGGSYSPTPSSVTGKRPIIYPYCTPYYYYNQYFGSGDPIGITNVTMGSINNSTGTSGANNNAYYDYTHLSTNVTKSSSNNITVTVGDPYNYTYQYVGVHIDWNQDGDFYDTDETYGYNSAAVQTSKSFTIVPPCGALNGSTRMRVMVDYFNYTYWSPCPYYAYGEAEDYTINVVDSQRTVLSSVAAHTSLIDAAPGQTNVQLLKVRINAGGCSPNQDLTKLTFNTSGSNNPSTNIGNAKVYYTGTSSTFATTTQFGSTINNPSGTMNFTGSVTLPDSAWFWLVYTIDIGANLTEVVDAQIDSAVINSTSYVPSNNAPTGNITINNPATYVSSSCIMPITSSVTKGSTNQRILRMKVVMSNTGSPVLLDSVVCNTNGTNNVSTNIQNAKVWFTGNSSTFAITTQYGSTISSPSGALNFVSSSVSLLPGDNYLWLTYDIKSGANTGDSVTAEFNGVHISGTSSTPSNQTVSTKRKIIPDYCYHGDYYTYYNYGITNVTLGSINNSSSYPSNYTYYSHSDYTSLSTDLKQNATYTLSVGYNSVYGNNNVAAWIDFNNDGTFSSGEKIGQPSMDQNSSGTVSITFTVPCNAVSGTTRMRVREEYYANNGSSLNPCSTVYPYAGETEDYTINIIDSPRTLVSVVTTQASNVYVSPGQTNAEIVKVRVNSYGCSGTLNFTSLSFTTNGTTNTSDLLNAKVYYTGSSDVFATTTQFGSTISNPSGTYSVTGTQAISTDSAFFWVAYDVSSGASIGNVIDAEGSAVIIDGNTIGSNGTLSGSRPVSLIQSYVSATTTQNSNPVFVGTNNAHIIGVEVVMSAGSPQYVTNMNFNITGSTDANDIVKVRCFYTGNSSTFAATTQFGSDYNSPIYGASFSGNQALQGGTNYFWLAYNVSGSATLGNVLDAQFEDLDIDSASNTATKTPTTGNPTGSRTISPTYCVPNDYYYYSTGGISKVQLGTINNSTSLKSSAPTYSDYTSISTSLKRDGNYNLTVDAYNYNPNYVAAWADWNQDGDFSDANEKLDEDGSNTYGNYTVVLNFTVPCNALLGSTRLRIREEYYANNGAGLDPCTYTYQYGYGEVEDYTINVTDSALSIVSVNTTTASITDLFANSTNQKMIAVPVVVQGCTGSLSISQLDFSTNGSTSASDIANAKVFYTGNSSSFAVTTQYGSTVSNPSGSFSVTGSMALTSDTNWFWLAYDIASGATTNNYVDAECNSITVNSNNYTPTTQAPSGNRMINVPMSYTSSNVVNYTLAPIEKGSRKQAMVSVQIVMTTGAPVDLTQLNLSTSGSTDEATDLDSAKVYYTGNSSTFATTTLFGQYASPNGSFNVSGTQALTSGTNYFWVTYDIKSGATTGDSVDASCTQLTIASNNHTPSTTNPAGKRKIIPAYCVGTYYYDYHTQMYMSRIVLNGIDNTTSYLSSSPFYSNFTNLTCSTTIAQADTLQVQGSVGGGYNVRVGFWADLNQDGDFNDSGEKLGENQNVGNSGLYNILFTIPNGATVGLTRMRVRCTYQYSNVHQCNTLDYSGETEDYSMYISAPAAPTVSISPSTSTSFCQGIGQVFTATPSGSGYTYVWKEGTTVKQSGTGISYATYSYNPAYTGTYNITCEVTDQYAQTGVSAATSTTINPNAVGGTATITSTSICSGQNDTLNVTGNSGTIQWQSKIGSNPWTDISGANSSQYVVVPTTTTSYRCKSTQGSCGSAYSNIVTVSIGTSSVWIGSFSNDWFYGPNWCSGTVPTSSSNVTIGSGTYMPQVYSTAYVNSLTINSGATLNLVNGANLIVNGTYTRNGTLNHTGGTFTLNYAQNIPSGTHHQLKITGAGTYTLQGNLTINNNLVVGSGVTINDNSYTINAKRDVTIDGTLSGTGKLLLDNTSLNQTISGNATLGNVEVNMGSASLATRFYNNITIARKLTINGGFVVIYNGTTLTVGSTSTSTGDIKFNYSGAQIVSANSSYNTHLIINGNASAPQITGANITTNANVTLNRPNGMTLGGHTTIGGTLTLSAGSINASGYDLNIGKTSQTFGNYVSSGSSSISNTSSSGVLRFLGSSGSSQITNARLGTQYKMEVKRPSGISLGTSYTMNNNLSIGFSSSTIDLNGWVITFGVNASLTENNNTAISGSSGYIQTTRSYGSALSNNNIAGFGMVLSTSSAPGSTTIVRGHTAQSSGGYPSIKRYYTVTAANASSISVTNMILNFVSSEYNGFTSATSLAIARSNNGGSSWTHIGTYSRGLVSGTAGYAAAAGFGGLSASGSMFTVGDSLQGYSPVVASVANTTNAIENVWPNPFNENVNLTLNVKEEGTLVIRMTDMNGKVVKSMNVKAAAGSNNILLSDLKELPAGAYMINVISNDNVNTMRVIKANN